MEMADRGIRVNSVNSGFIETNTHISAGVPENQFAAFAEMNRLKAPLLRIGYTEGCVNAIAFVANDNASFLTGVILPVDGGISTKGAF